MKETYYFAIRPNGWVVYKGTIRSIAEAVAGERTVWQSRKPIPPAFPEYYNPNRFIQIS